MLCGTGQPKIKTSSGTEILIQNISVLKDEPEYDILEHASDLTGEKTFYGKGYHWIYEGHIYINKHTYPYEKYLQLKSALFDNVTFWRHRDREPFKDASGAIVPFFVSAITPYYLSRAFPLPDAVYIRLQSTKYVDISYCMLEGEPVDDLDRLVEDDLGRALGIS